MRTFFRNLGLTLGLTPALLALLLISTAATTASNGAVASTRTLAAGAYVVDVSLSQDPPQVDTPLEVIVVPHDKNLHLQGYLTVEPGLGTDATPQRFTLSENQGTLRSTIHIPVRGAWDIVVTLNGPQGQGTSKVAVTVAAPGAIPVWLGWLIGASPLVLVAFWIWRQHLYKRSLPAPADQQG
ncbi:MAG TPA: hypothetical protein VHD63_13670 [Ktedonobacteraceae bacterium]|nr:hypothetical protein [Ktedonobacteraceae bacterium]